MKGYLSAIFVAWFLSSCDEPPSSPKEAEEAAESGEAADVVKEAIKKKEESIEATSEEGKGAEEGKSLIGENLVRGSSGMKRR